MLSEVARVEDKRCAVSCRVGTLEIKSGVMNGFARDVLNCNPKTCPHSSLRMQLSRWENKSKTSN
jgi:hypothetical protein